MSGTEEKRTNVYQGKRWLITIGIFIILQFIFIAIDGTMLEPNITDSGNLLPRIGRWILDSKLFTEWITPYSYPFFNMFMAIHIIAILIQAVHDIISSIFTKKQR
ncbi:YfzA family protein [Salipaludibacillus sp. HK11]|uniref:YfzA family protein n=1 Tax=Salipaludibacillus sp. HK11 TaxID=3394320 RepID=UPI0039FC71CA